MKIWSRAQEATFKFSFNAHQTVLSTASKKAVRPARIETTMTSKATKYRKDETS